MCVFRINSNKGKVGIEGKIHLISKVSQKVYFGTF